MKHRGKCCYKNKNVHAHPQKQVALQYLQKFNSLWMSYHFKKSGEEANVWRSVKTLKNAK